MEIPMFYIGDDGEHPILWMSIMENPEKIMDVYTDGLKWMVYSIMEQPIKMNHNEKHINYKMRFIMYIHYLYLLKLYNENWRSVGSNNLNLQQ